MKYFLSLLLCATFSSCSGDNSFCSVSPAGEDTFHVTMNKKMHTVSCAPWDDGYAFVIWWGLGKRLEYKKDVSTTFSHARWQAYETDNDSKVMYRCDLTNIKGGEGVMIIRGQYFSLDDGSFFLVKEVDGKYVVKQLKRDTHKMENYVSKETHGLTEFEFLAQHDSDIHDFFRVKK